MRKGVIRPSKSPVEKSGPGELCASTKQSPGPLFTDFIQLPLRSVNQIYWGHWRAKHRKRNEFQTACNVLIGSPGLPVQCRRLVKVTFHSYRRQDPANRSAACKELLDSLVKLGWLKDDSDEWLEWPTPRQKIIPRTQPEGFWLEISNAPPYSE